MNRLETLKNFEMTLERFLTSVGKLETEQISTLRSINVLDDIARDSLKGRYVNNRLGDWMAKNRLLVDEGRLKKSAISAVGNLLSEIRKGLDISDPESKKLSEEIENWRAKGIVPGRKLVLARPPENPDQDISLKFSKLFKQEADLLAFYFEKGDHILSILDDLLKSAEAKEDPMYMHLAGSIIYFLKGGGYKIEPYVKRLKAVEKKKFGEAHAD